MAGPIRQPIDIDALQQYLERNVPEIEMPMDVKQFGYGQSNPTYLLTSRNGSRFVMRKKPPGKLLSKTAHRVDREYRILHALGQTDVAVPRTYCFCEDEAVVGTPFYVMEFLDGRIYEDPEIIGVTPEERTEMWHDAIRTLGKMHRIPPASVNLSTFGKSKGFYNRQISLFRTLCDVQANTRDVETQKPVGKIPHNDEMVRFFEQVDTQPRDIGTLLHGDYKIDNLIFHKTEPKVIGILDWEMSTIGHPLADLCNLLTPYVTATSEVAQRLLGSDRGVGASSQAFRPSNTPGLPTQAQCIAWYSEVAGWEPLKAELAWGNAFNLFKGCVIMQGIGARYAVRQASSARAQEYGAKKDPMGEVTWELVQKCKQQGQNAKL